MSRRKKNNRKTIIQRIDAVIIPGSTGGFYTLVPGIMIIFILLGIYIYAFVKGKTLPEPFVELLWVGVALMGIQNGRAVFDGRSASRIAQSAVDEADIGEEVEVESPSSNVKVRKQAVQPVEQTEEEKEAVKG